MKLSRMAQRRKLVVVYLMICLAMVALLCRLMHLMVNRSDYFAKKAKQVQQRERVIKAKRGGIYDRNGNLLAGNKPVSTISVIHNQIEDPQKVIKTLSEILEIPESDVKKRVEKVSSIEKIKSNVDRERSDKIRAQNLAGVMIDEDYKRYYPYDSLASKVIGFTGGDNQGIIGLEVTYDSILQGQDGAILTTTTARGLEIDGVEEEREEPLAGKDLYTSIDLQLQQYAMQTAKKIREQKNAKTVRIIMMNPQNGEIYCMVNEPEFSLENPYEITQDFLQLLQTDGETVSKGDLTEKQKNDALNQMWRNACISDTYEPGSTFKVIVATNALKQGVVSEQDGFFCPGYKVVEDRRIRCHKVKGHGSQTFAQGVQNSCNPVFMEVGQRLGVRGFFQGLTDLGILQKTGIDVPGEAVTIMHKEENVGPVELATMSFGQSFQLSPIRLLTSVSAVINGGTMVVPHFGVSVYEQETQRMKALRYETSPDVIPADISERMKVILEGVVTEGGGSKAAVEGYRVGAKTGTSQKLPRGSGKYIASCLGFAPVDNPKVIALVMIDEPVGMYYGGIIAAPIISELLDNSLSYLGVTATEEKKSAPTG